MDGHERLLGVFSSQRLNELDMEYGWLPLLDEAGLGHIFRAINNDAGLQEHIFIRYPNADGFKPGVTYAVQRVSHQDGVTQREDIFQIHWGESGYIDFLSFNGPVNISVQQSAKDLRYSFYAGGHYEIPAILEGADVSQRDRLFQPSTP